MSDVNYNLTCVHCSPTKIQHRVLKKYKLNYRLAPGTKFAHSDALVPGHDIVMLTSASGVISSIDEFYAVSGRHTKMSVAGVDIRYEPQRLLPMNLENYVFSAARVMAANRLANSPRNWSKLMKRDPWGAQQWLLIDRKVLHSYNSFVTRAKQNELVNAMIDDRQTPSVSADEKESVATKVISGLVWVVDNVPGRLHAEDVTGIRELVLSGDPHFAETLIESGITTGGADAGFEYLKDGGNGNGLIHSLKFSIKATDVSDYAESLTALRSGDNAEESAWTEGDDDKGPTFSTDSVFKWSWT